MAIRNFSPYKKIISERNCKYINKNKIVPPSIDRCVIDNKELYPSKCIRGWIQSKSDMAFNKLFINNKKKIQKEVKLLIAFQTITKSLKTFMWNKDQLV